MATEKTVGAYLEITLKVNENDRAAAAAVYTKYRQPFLDTISGAVSKQLLVRGEDVQVLHGFTSTTEAEGYLVSMNAPFNGYTNIAKFYIKDYIRPFFCFATTNLSHFLDP